MPTKDLKELRLPSRQQVANFARTFCAQLSARVLLMLSCIPQYIAQAFIPNIDPMEISHTHYCNCDIDSLKLQIQRLSQPNYPQLKRGTLPRGGGGAVSKYTP